MRPILYTGVILMVAAACTGIVEAPDEGNDSTGVAVCSSGTYWKDNGQVSDLMHPGGKCIACHIAVKAPIFTFAGTVYPTLHEPDDCNGVNGTDNVTVVITDGSDRTMPPVPVNSSGNFKFSGQVIPPFHVKIVSKGKESKMLRATNSGDCNSCHTQTGAEGAPGRIVAP